jgi:hypothetical protein
MVIERLGNPEKFLRVSEAVTATPDPPARPCIPVESAPVRLRPCGRECRRDPIAPAYRRSLAPTSLADAFFLPVFAPSLRFRESRSNPALDLG